MMLTHTNHPNASVGWFVYRSEFGIDAKTTCLIFYESFQMYMTDDLYEHKISSPSVGRLDGWLG